jgi:hypothetical protein
MKVCVRGYELKVLHSAAGYYIGTVDEDGLPNCRLSEKYWKGSVEAQKALDTLCFRDRSYAIETQYCNGGMGCRIKEVDSNEM